ncbi:MAG: glutathione peroxidase [Melioribacteraceae bacterium]
MKKIFFVVIAFLFAVSFINASEKDKKVEPIYNITVKNMDGKEVKLSDYKGKVLLIVNVASKCGYTKQYAGLQKIYDQYKSKGFEILAFPCNDFGGQEPGTNEEIQEFCSSKFDVKFPLFDKVKVLGDSKAPLYSLLTNNDSVEKGDIKWNFEKFLISKDGKIVERFRSKVEPESKEMTSSIEKELAK